MKIRDELRIKRGKIPTILPTRISQQWPPPTTTPLMSNSCAPNLKAEHESILSTKHSPRVSTNQAAPARTAPELRPRNDDDVSNATRRDTSAKSAPLTAARNTHRAEHQDQRRNEPGEPSTRTGTPNPSLRNGPHLQHPANLPRGQITPYSWKIASAREAANTNECTVMRTNVPPAASTSTKMEMPSELGPTPRHPTTRTL